MQLSLTKRSVWIITSRMMLHTQCPGNPVNKYSKKYTEKWKRKYLSSNTFSLSFYLHKQKTSLKQLYEKPFFTQHDLIPRFRADRLPYFEILSIFFEKMD